jgi:16S rRNA (guanine527-N7)-methyltransferase
MTPAAVLAAGLTALDLQLPPGVSEKLLDYLALIDKWNRVYNLTAVRDRESMVTQHLLDSLVVVPHLAGTTVLDVGSGAGLPGIPLALARPGSSVTLLEANAKKSTFLKQVAIELELRNVEVTQARVESWAAPHAYDVVISRAFASVAEFAVSSGRHVAEGGVLAAMKGAYPRNELEELPAPYELICAIPLNVPQLRAERHLVLMRRR